LDDADCTKVEVKELIGKILGNPLIDGVCITGGEPTLQVDGVVEICQELKKKGMRIKIDTNGSRPENLGPILDFVDYIAIDIKAPLDPEKYSKAAGIKNGREVVENVRTALEMINLSGKEFEVRTTVVPTLTYENDLVSIANSLRAYGINSYTLQQFRPEWGCLDKKFETYAPPSRDYLVKIGKRLKKFLPAVIIRTKENGEEKV
jgi:pyruvate formate lyase activating enzyme